MIYNQTILAIIPARAGSKRLPGKNMKMFDGKPLLEWTIIAAKGSKYIDSICLSTDIEEAFQFGQKYDIWISIRPSQLATDGISPEMVASNIIENEFGGHDYVLLLQPTSPLRTAQDIDRAIENLFAPVDSLISFRQNGNVLEPNGAIYIKRTNRLLAGEEFYSPHNSRIFVIPPERSIDIDTQEDFDRAENASRENSIS
jgi:CMP-N,N'-diacetyllegionaminic acid synthase